MGTARNDAAGTTQTLKIFELSCVDGRKESVGTVTEHLQTANSMV